MKDEKINGHPVRCYDNGGASCDRYTAVYMDQHEPGRALFASVGMSAAPFHPQGFGQHGMASTGRHLGRRIPFADLPPDCQRLVKRDLEG
jgi:hypothetical protein